METRLHMRATDINVRLLSVCVYGNVTSQTLHYHIQFRNILSSKPSMVQSPPAKGWNSSEWYYKEQSCFVSMYVSLGRSHWTHFLWAESMVHAVWHSPQEAIGLPEDSFSHQMLHSPQQRQADHNQSSEKLRTIVPPRYSFEIFQSSTSCLKWSEGFPWSFYLTPYDLCRSWVVGMHFSGLWEWFAYLNLKQACIQEIS